ncbi:MAG: multiheme c-type cytochrome [Granulosicoccus sp.]
MIGLFQHRSLRASLVLLVCGLVATPFSQTHALDVFADTHLGAATCATSQCHGKSSPQADRNVSLNEYTTWIDGDRHSIAYQTLQSEESKRIAANLGISRAESAGICLDCHADNAPADKRGPKFQVSDGVGCEACHGGSGRWIETHTDPDATHARNLAMGMIATEKADVRAEVCLSCHLGTKDKFATHTIMGAGHPRLSFELDLFSANQPAHYTVDADYIERKGTISGFNLWLTGQFESAEQHLIVGIQRLHDGVGMFPDFAFFDCQSCHHSLKNQRWTKQRADGVLPGSLRLHMPNLVVLDAVARSLGADDIQASLQAAKVSTIKSAQLGRQEFKESVQNLTSVLAAARQSWAREFSIQEVKAVRRALVENAATDRASDYAEAEQIYYSLESLCYTLDDIDRCAGALDQLFESISDSDTYSPWRFTQLAKTLVDNF